MNKTYNFCNNCGKNGHLFHSCKKPITSSGIICFTKQNNKLKYLKYFSNKLKLKKNIVFNEKVISAKYIEKNNLWKIQTNNKKKYYTKLELWAKYKKY